MSQLTSDAAMVELLRMGAGDPLALHDQINHLLDDIEDGDRLEFLHRLLARREAVVVRLAIYWLLDPDPAIRALAARHLGERAKLSADDRRRLTLARNWLPPGPARDAVTERFGDAPPARPPGRQPRPVRIAGLIPDGAGAQQFLYAVRRKSGYQVALVLIKAGVGILDGMLMTLPTDDYHDLIAQLDDLGQIDLDADAWRLPIAAALAEGLAADRPPAAALLDIAPLTGLTDLAPVPLSLADWQERADPEGSVTADERPALVAASADWINRYPLMESWLDHDRDLRTHLRACAPDQRLAEMTEAMEGNRALWALQCLKMAYLLGAAGDPRGRREAVAVAQALLGDTPLDAIPVAGDIINRTVDSLDEEFLEEEEEDDDSPFAPAWDPEAFDLESTTEPLAALGAEAGINRSPDNFDGFLSAVLAAPSMTPPSAWLPALMGEDAAFGDETHAQQFIAVMLGRFHALGEALSNLATTAALIDAIADPADWARGFADAISSDPDAWRADALAPEDREMLARIRQATTGALPDTASLAGWLHRKAVGEGA